MDSANYKQCATQYGQSIAKCTFEKSKVSFDAGIKASKPVLTGLFTDQPVQGLPLNFRSYKNETKSKLSPKRSIVDPV